MAEEYLLVSRSEYDQMSKKTVPEYEKEDRILYSDEKDTTMSERQDVKISNDYDENGTVENVQSNGYNSGVIENENNVVHNTQKHFNNVQHSLSLVGDDSDDSNDSNEDMYYDRGQILSGFSDDELQYIHPLLGYFYVYGKKLSYNSLNGRIMCNSKYIPNSNIKEFLQMTVNGKSCNGCDIIYKTLAELGIPPRFIKDKQSKLKYVRMITGLVPNKAVGISLGEGKYKMDEKDKKDKIKEKKGKKLERKENKNSSIKKPKAEPVIVDDIFSKWLSA